MNFSWEFEQLNNKECASRKSIECQLDNLLRFVNSSDESLEVDAIVPLVSRMYNHNIAEKNLTSLWKRITQRLLILVSFDKIPWAAELLKSEPLDVLYAMTYNRAQDKSTCPFPNVLQSCLEPCLSEFCHVDVEQCYIISTFLAVALKNKWASQDEIVASVHKKLCKDRNRAALIDLAVYVMSRFEFGPPPVQMAVDLVVPIMMESATPCATVKEWSYLVRAEFSTYDRPLGAVGVDFVDCLVTTSRKFTSGHLRARIGIEQLVPLICLFLW